MTRPQLQRNHTPQRQHKSPPPPPTTSRASERAITLPPENVQTVSPESLEEAPSPWLACTADGRRVIHVTSRERKITWHDRDGISQTRTAGDHTRPPRWQRRRFRHLHFSLSPREGNDVPLRSALLLAPRPMLPRTRVSYAKPRRDNDHPQGFSPGVEDLCCRRRLSEQPQVPMTSMAYEG
jgi:hypothetical protein